ncbi:TNF receptor-associated factor 6, partial [Geodia barretti]
NQHRLYYNFLLTWLPSRRPVALLFAGASVWRLIWRSQSRAQGLQTSFSPPTYFAPLSPLSHSLPLCGLPYSLPYEGPDRLLSRGRRMEGYDAKFDPPLEKRLECPICLLAQREPMQTPCGHRFCSACILRALRETGPRCPVDNTTVCVHQLFKDNFAKREVLSLNVHCSADQCGCSWQGELRDLQVHNKQCELVLIECPNSCGHSCRRKNLQDHLPTCTNRPEKCSTCSIRFPRSSLADHHPHCSHIVIPDSVSSAIDKACEVLKWVGHLKLKLNGQVCQLTGYLTAPSDSEQSQLATSCWCSSITFITLNSLASQIFSRMLTSSEVQPVLLNFSLLTSDPKSLAFQKIFRKKPEICVSIVAMH